MCGGGGGGGAPKAVAAAAKKVVAQSKPAATKSTPAAAKPATTSFFDSAAAGGDNTNAAATSAAGQASQAAQQFFSGAASQGVAEGDKSKRFIPGAGEGGRDSLEEALGGRDVTVMTGKSPFRNQHRRQFLERDFRENPDVPGADAIVEDQANVQGIMSASAEGEGAQGFGQRALAGDEAAIVATDATGSNAVETGLPAEIAQSDLQMDPNYVAPAPGKIYIGDQAYNVPVMGQDLSAFVPNSREAVMRAAGPMSRGLMSARSGFGRRFF